MTTGGNPDRTSAAQRRLTDCAVPGAFIMILVLGALLRAWHLNQPGFGTQYYAAGVMSMLESWHNFFFNSFDPAGFVSIDKPPLAFWLQAASAKILGFSGLSIRLPQVIEGVTSIALLYHLVQRRFGRSAGFLAALFLAITPISVAVDRSNNTDSCLVLVLLAAALALSIAAESGKRRPLVVSMVLLGIGFNVKMLAALVVLPPFALVYLLGASLPMRRKAADLLLAGVLLVAVSLSWCAAYDLTPAQLRPYAGSTKTNSMLELVIGENGVRRFVRGQRLGRAAAGAPNGAQPSNGSGGPTGGNRQADHVPVGPLRLASPLLAIQMGWLYPLAIIGVAAWLWRRRPRLPLEPMDCALLLWAGWALTYGVVLSYAGGIFHAYYLAAMTPPVDALAAVGVVRLWDWYRAGGRRALVLPFALLAAVAWQGLISRGYLNWQMSTAQRDIPAPGEALGQLQHVLMITPIAVGLLAAVGLLLAWVVAPNGPRGWSPAALGAGILAVILTPATWALGSMQAKGNASFPTAQPPVIGERVTARARGVGASADAQLVAFLSGHYHDERFLLATLSAQQAAPIIIATGKPVMAMGGFAGADPILSPDSLNRMVQGRELRFALIGATDGAGAALRGAAAQTPLVQWIEQHGVLVEPALWRSPRGERRDDSSRTVGRRIPRTRDPNAATLRLFDLKPDAAPESSGVPAGQ